LEAIGLMYVCRLFHRDQPFEQIDARLLAGGKLTVGRDTAADWTLADEAGTLSRIHFTLAVEGEALTIIDSSTNGTFLPNGERVPRDVPMPLAVRDVLRFGALSLLVDRPDESEIAPDRTQFLPAGFLADLPKVWVEDGTPIPPRPRHQDESLIEAFCEGANLDSSALSGEDPAELMRRLGALYQQAVLGLATLMTERARLKGDHSLDQTTISAADNNPFKWMPTRKLATTLLCTPQPGFLGDAEAVRASFEDVARHLAGLAAGGNAALLAVMERLSPASIDAEAQAQGFSLKGRAAVARDIHARRHAALAGSDRGIVDRAFAQGYAGAGDADAPEDA
jgi:predicted component of type VI protein secretion system